MTMSKTEFDRFVQSQQAEQRPTADFDPKQQLLEWRHYLDVLYKKIEGYMASYIAEGAAKITLGDIDLNEEFSGPYTVRQMLLEIGRSSITFKPIGTMLIGAKGRVDVQGPRGSARLGLVNKNATRGDDLVRVTVSEVGRSQQPSSPNRENEKIEWAWKIMASPPDMRFIDLTQGAFFDMILAVAGG